MNIIKKTALTFFMAISLIATSTVAVAEVANSSSAAIINETIAHIEKAIVEVNKSDFAAANLHIRSARNSSEQITGNEAIVKKANASVIQGHIQSKSGQIKKATEYLNTGIELYKTI